MLLADYFGVPFYSQWVCNAFHWVWCCLLIILWCQFTLRRYLMFSIGCNAAYWLCWVLCYSQKVCDVFYWVWCCLLIILRCLSTFSGYVMSSIACDTVHWSFWGVILLSAGMWCLLLGVMLPADHFGVLWYFQEVCNVFYWEWCYLLIIFGVSFYSQRVCDVFHWVW